MNKRTIMIYKIFRDAEWAELKSSGQSFGAPIDVQDGYVHFSTRETVAETAAKYFANMEGLVLLAVSIDECPDLKWEPSRGGALFPHLYRQLEIKDVVWAKPLPCTGTGHVFPEGVL